MEVPQNMVELCREGKHVLNRVKGQSGTLTAASQSTIRNITKQHEK